MPKKVRVHVYEADGEFRVHPAVVDLDAAAPKDDIDWFNHTDEDMVCYFGPGLLDANATSELVAKKGGKSETRKPHSQGQDKLKFATYQIFMVQSGKKAKGNSDPVIIIEN